MALINVSPERPLVLQGPVFNEAGSFQGFSRWAQDGSLWYVGVQASNRPTVLWRNVSGNWERVTVIGTVPVSTKGYKWQLAQHSDGKCLMTHQGVVSGDAVTGQFINADGSLDGSSFTLANQSAAQYSTNNNHIGVAPMMDDYWVVAYGLDNGFSQLAYVNYKMYNGSSWSSHYQLSQPPPSGGYDWRCRAVRVAWWKNQLHFASVQVLDGGTKLANLYYMVQNAGLTGGVWQTVDGPVDTSWSMRDNHCDLVADDNGIHICGEKDENGGLYEVVVYTLNPGGGLRESTQIGQSTTYYHSPRLFKLPFNQLMVLMRDEDDNGDHHLYMHLKNRYGEWEDRVMMSYIIPGFAPTSNPQQFFPSEPDYNGFLPRVCCFWQNNPGPLSDDDSRYWNCGELDYQVLAPDSIYLLDGNVGDSWCRWKGDE